MTLSGQERVNSAEMQRKGKIVVAKAKERAYDDFFIGLNSGEGEKDLSSSVKWRNQDGKDVQVRTIKRWKYTDRCQT